MKYVSWNVNGVRAAAKKGALDYLKGTGADCFCLQETKADNSTVEKLDWGSEWHIYANEAEKKGYSGTAIMTRRPPISCAYGMGAVEHNREGRVITLEFEDFHLVNVYTPNSQDGLRRLAYRQRWDADFRVYLKQLEKHKPVVVCGDLNVAHTEDDLARPKANRKNAGFTDEERAGFGELVHAGFIDTFREFTSGNGHYSWWSYRGGARDRNVGWRIDYFLISEMLRDRLKAATIEAEILGSDHCPITVTLA